MEDHLDLESAFGLPIPFRSAKCVPYHSDKFVRPSFSTELRIRVIQFSIADQALLWLSELTGIVTDNLREMNTSYVYGIIFSADSESLCIFRNGVMVGGATYKLFPSGQFAELIFFCIHQADHSRGVGTRLMNEFKNHLQSLSIFHILTYADETALGFFETQGFSRTVQLDPAVWHSHISHYAGAVLVHCVISDAIDYDHLDDWRKSLGDFLTSQGQIPERLPLRHFPQDSVLGIPIGPEPHVPLTDIIHAILFKVERSRGFRMFSHLCSKTAFPDYYEMIKHPMSLDIIQGKIAMKEYGTIQAFLDDLFLIVNNCLEFNPPESKFHKAALALKQVLHDCITQYGITYPAE
jgi:histone acetyltransferase